MPVFNRWDVVAKGWYIACSSRALPQRKAVSLNVCGQRIVLFRGDDGRVRALDAFCPHLGTDLGLGRVEGTWIRCAFHHWAFDGAGTCQNIPCQAEIPAHIQVQAYAAEEKYGFIWVYPDAEAPYGVAEFDDLQGKSIAVLPEFTAKLDCHPHLYMINAVDGQHLQTIHKLPQMTPSVQQTEDRSTIQFTFRGEFDANSFKGQLVGTHYEYTVRYVDGSLALLTNVKQGRWLPTLHTLFAPVSIAPGTTRIQPIFLAERKPGIRGRVATWLALLIARYVYLHVLLVDREIRVFNNIRFNPAGLLPIDAPIAKFIQYVNQLQPSRWSRSTTKRMLRE